MGIMRYAVLIEQADTNYSAYAPDLPGCCAVGDTIEETMQEMREAIEFHIQGLKKDGLLILEPSTLCDYIDLSAA